MIKKMENSNPEKKRITPEEKYEMLSRFEKEAFSKGYKICAGIDEAGRGPLAGPVVAAACILNWQAPPILGLDDSKKLSEKKREVLYEQIISSALAYSTVRVEADIIDEINILEATRQAMRKCVESLSVKPDLVLIDGLDPGGIHAEVRAVIKGDSLSNSIAAASILAKVTRDCIMKDYDDLYPGYHFSQHKGYGTKAHYEAIDQLSFCPIHRKSFLKNKYQV